jgi:hypothetical protein
LEDVTRDHTAALPFEYNRIMNAASGGLPTPSTPTSRSSAAATTTAPTTPQVLVNGRLFGILEPTRGIGDIDVKDMFVPPKRATTPSSSSSSSNGLAATIPASSSSPSSSSLAATIKSPSRTSKAKKKSSSPKKSPPSTKKSGIDDLSDLAKTLPRLTDDNFDDDNDDGTDNDTDDSDDEVDEMIEAMAKEDASLLNRLEGESSLIPLTCHPDIRQLTLSTGSFLLLATDGIWDVMTSSMACSIIQDALAADTGSKRSGGSGRGRGGRGRGSGARGGSGSDKVGLAASSSSTSLSIDNNVVMNGTTRADRAAASLVTHARGRSHNTDDITVILLLF